MTSKFQRGSGVYTCRNCNKTTRETGEGEAGLELCANCFYEGGLENEHYDGYHNAEEDGPNADCPLCVGA